MNISRLPRRIFGKISKYIHASGNITIITGANTPFYESLRDNLLSSIMRNEPKSDIIVWDLGLTDEQVNELRGILQRHQGRSVIRQYNEKELPSHYAMKNWNYAFKSYCIAQSLPNITTKFAMWLDAGCGIAGPLDSERNLLQMYGYFSPYSSTTVKALTYPSVLHNFMAIHVGIASKQMLSGGVQGWNMQNKKALALLSDWVNLIRSKENIAPEGADLTNHRFDQSLLSILYYGRYNKMPYFCRYLYNIKIHLNK